MDFARKLMPENLCGLLATPAETESSSQAARLSPESGLRSEAVKNLIHNSTGCCSNPYFKKGLQYFTQIIAS